MYCMISFILNSETVTADLVLPGKREVGGRTGNKDYKGETGKFVGHGYVYCFDCVDAKYTHIPNLIKSYMYVHIYI